MFPVVLTQQAQQLRGVTDYAAHCGTWMLDRNPELSAASLRTLAGWSGDGVVASLETVAELRAAKTLGVPVVNLSATLHNVEFPRVTVDQQAVGRLAAEHLLERGFRRTGYFGQHGVWYSQQREQGFVERIRQGGGDCSVLEVPRHFGVTHPWHRWLELLEEWLKTLECPVGVMAVHDHRARMVLDACLRLGLRVPEDVALIGFENDEVACQFGQVPLSSVGRNSWGEGYEAAALLDRLMAGRRPPHRDIFIPPGGVVARRSTDMAAIEDPHVAAAVQFIREHLDQPLNVKVLEQHIAISHSYLYCHFKQCLNCTPHQYINRVRIQRAKELLADPDKQKLHHIARVCGFSETRRLRLVFRRLTGQTLGDYRRAISERR